MGQAGPTFRQPDWAQLKIGWARLDVLGMLTDQALHSVLT